jgi:hypothetical protein
MKRARTSIVSAFLLFTLAALAASACGEDTGDPAEELPVAAESAAVNGCTGYTADLITAAYERGFGRLPDTQEGAGAHEMAYWCNWSGISGATSDQLTRYMSQWLKQNGTARTETIKRAYRAALGRAPERCELDYWYSEIPRQTSDGPEPVAFERLTWWMATYAAEHGYYWRNYDVGELIGLTLNVSGWVSTGRWGYTAGYVPFMGC